MNLVKRVLERSGELTFDEAANSPESVAGATVMRFGWVCDWLRQRPIAARRVVDLGCFTGGLLRQLQSVFPEAELWGVDIDGPWLDVAAKVVPSGQFRAVASLTTLPSTVGERFDVACFLETMEHLPKGSEPATLAAIAASLEPGGQLVLSVPLGGPMALLDPAWALLGHRHYRPSTLRRLCDDAGLAVVDFGYSGNGWTIVGEFLHYWSKHVRHRANRPHPGVRSRADTGIGPYRRWSATNVYLRAEKPA